MTTAKTASDRRAIDRRFVIPFAIASAVPLGLVAARGRKVRLHARLMTGLFTGGLVFAGALAFLPGRLIRLMWLLVFG